MVEHGFRKSWVLAFCLSTLSCNFLTHFSLFHAHIKLIEFKPITMLIVYIFYLLAYTGKQNEPDAESFLVIIENADAYQALLWGTMAAALTAVGFYFIQDKHLEKIIFFNIKGYISRMRRMYAYYRGKCRRRQGKEIAEEGEGVVHARVLMTYTEAMAAFIIGMEKIFTALVVLTLAWASGAIMTAVGLSKFFHSFLLLLMF